MKRETVVAWALRLICIAGATAGTVFWLQGQDDTPRITDLGQVLALLTFVAATGFAILRYPAAES